MTTIQKMMKQVQQQEKKQQEDKRRQEEQQKCIENLNLYIPYAFDNVSKDELRENLKNMGKITHIELVAKLDKHNMNYNSVYIYFEYWFPTPENRQIQAQIKQYTKSQNKIHSFKFYYNGNLHWIILENTSPRQEPNSERRRPIIDLKTAAVAAEPLAVAVAVAVAPAPAPLAPAPAPPAPTIATTSGQKILTLLRQFADNAPDPVPAPAPAKQTEFVPPISSKPSKHINKRIGMVSVSIDDIKTKVCDEKTQVEFFNLKRKIDEDERFKQHDLFIQEAQIEEEVQSRVRKALAQAQEQAAMAQEQAAMAQEQAALAQAQEQEEEYLSQYYPSQMSQSFYYHYYMMMECQANMMIESNDMDQITDEMDEEEEAWNIYLEQIQQECDFCEDNEIGQLEEADIYY